MIKKIVELRGREAGAWLESLDRNPNDVEAVHAWVTREELYRLQFYVEEPTGWEGRGSLLGSGPLLVKDRVVPLDVSRVRGNQLRIRLRPPAGFWALNSFAVSYATDRPLDFQRVAPVMARTVEGRNVLPELLESDDRYYSMPDNADRAEITFPAPRRKADLDRTVLLHSRGWYQLHLAPGGEPEMKKLEEITQVRDGAVRYAADEYTRWRHSSDSRPREPDDR